MAILNIQPENKTDAQYIFRGSTVLMLDTAEIVLPSLAIAKQCIEENFATDWFVESNHAYSALLLEENAPTPAHHRWCNVRELYAAHEKGEQSPAPLCARALSLLHWRKLNRFCGRCGGSMQEAKLETARVCSECGNTVFPRISPAIIVLVERGSSILLARHAKRNTNVYTCLAGFVENGETLEECVSREILEESGIKVTNIRYAASQPWPYPDQLMLAFHADYESGDLVLQDDEIDDAAWFEKDKLPSIPPPGSVAHRLITGIV